MTVEIISLVDLPDAVNDVLTDYVEHITEGITANSMEAAETCKTILRKNSPRQHGDYAKSWKISPKKGRPGEPTKYIVHNEKHYRLTHLLEYGHAIKNEKGQLVGRAAPQMHITRAEAEAIEQYLEGVEVLLRGR